ncbi:uncharacterized protein LOC112600050 [Melanaphis sacchari]|uniref:uncharacterized protein LOC112600050 n=1 Tax=Melanaphis sacchari TaxID=742174 RepID=UPI000DC14225|nr:uncharacterized protein LOC112600050 [Melanaphis sacchari]
MEHLCPEINQLVSCFMCGSQTLPPYRLCAEAHVGCPPCIKYLSRCACGCRFLRRSNMTFDWLISALKLQCKYRSNCVYGGRRLIIPGQVDCTNKWFSVQELSNHYLTGCMRNFFTCPMQNCGYVARVDTITDHYDKIHGPFELLSPSDYHQTSNCVMFKLPTKKQVQILKKIFNGYFMFSVKPYRRMHQDFKSLLSMQNINPSDSFQYTYTASLESHQNAITVTVTLMEIYNCRHII